MLHKTGVSNDDFGQHRNGRQSADVRKCRMRRKEYEHEILLQVLQHARWRRKIWGEPNKVSATAEAARYVETEMMQGCCRCIVCTEARPMIAYRVGKAPKLSVTVYLRCRIVHGDYSCTLM